MEIYIFGSVVRGEIDNYSDVDLLILKEKDELLSEIDSEQYSIYTYQRISEIWNEGNPFSWHLYVESKCVFSNNNVSFLKSLGTPGKYNNLLNDLDKFKSLYESSKTSILEENYSVDFDLSMIFLSIRNFATCFALGFLDKHEFSRDSAIRLGRYSLQIDHSVYETLKKSRLLATRGKGKHISENDLIQIKYEFIKIENWFTNLLNLSN